MRSNNTIICLAAITVVVMVACCDVLADGVEENFGGGWRFAGGEQAEAVRGAGFDDSGWEAVNVPHDWAIEGPFNPKENGYAGKLPWKGVGWYRKSFKLKGVDRGKRVYFDFDGVMAFPQVYVNGKLAGEWDYGYMSFRVDATDYVKFGGDNIIAVRADTRQHGTRWYPGAGIYRRVTMRICEPVHVGHWGSFVTTPEVSDETAKVCVSTAIENHLTKGAKVSVEVLLTDPDGRKVAIDKSYETVAAGGSSKAEQKLVVNRPQRWDVDSPKLYTAKTIVRVGRKVVDTAVVSFGIRTFEFTADDGFHLNGRRVQLNGVNLHHDHGPLGAAFYRRAMERQLEIMQEMGCNAIRTSHNPSSPELLELCDRMGIVVWNECFDKWAATADRVDGKPPLEEHGEKQIRNLVMRDRNHPCVVVWSIGNEIGNQPYLKEGKSAERVKFMRDFVLKYDSTRPVGIGCCIPGTVDEPILDSLDLTGWNYGRRYDRYRAKYPDKPIIYSESASTLSTRGFYELPLPSRKTDFSEKHQVDSYDLNSASWSDIPDVEFKLMEDDSFVAGEMVWTGFDYIGEPTPFSQEAKSSYFGIVDLCGIPKDRYYLYRSHWRPDELTVHILPHWNWPERVGQAVPVFVYTNGDSAELFLNGKSLGKRTKGQVPKKPVNLAIGGVAAASSEQSDYEHFAGKAINGDSASRWCAKAGGSGQWWQVDLGKVQPVRYISIEFEKEEKNYGYEVEVSNDGSSWQSIVTKAASNQPQWGGPSRIFHEMDAKARYVRVVFKDMKGNTWASIRQFGVYSETVESDYYDVTYKYRLRWNDVVYGPGELKAVAYKDGKRIGEAVMRTAGEAAAIRLTADRKKLSASGKDLSYILVEAVDSKGTVCALAENMIRFEVDGAGEIAGVGNGNPLSLEPFVADYRKLFYGKAMLIIRTVDGKRGRIRITAKSDGLKDGRVQLESK